MNAFVGRISLLLVSLAAAYPVLAHHAIVSTYDVSKNTSVQGVVTRFHFRNPHVRVYFDVTEADGSVTSWVGDGSAATILRREGWTSDTLKAGEFIQIIGSSSRDGSPMVMMGSVSILNDDRSIAREIYGSVEDFSETYDAALVKRPLLLADDVPNLAGIWTGQGSPYTPPRGVTPVLSEAGQAVQATYDITNDPQVFCDKPGLVRQAGMTPHGVRISQYDDRVVFEYEEYGVSSEAWFDTSRANSGPKTHFGNSVARYEDGALVVETTNLLSANVHAGGYRMSDQASVVQTYTRVDEPEHSSLLKIQTVVTDPVNYAEDFELINIKMASEEYDFIENGCVPPLRERVDVHPAMNLFVTSVGSSDETADAHCAALAGNVGQGDKDWRAFSDTTKDRIGSGPWYNAQGDLVGTDQDDLQLESVVTERGNPVNDPETDLFYCLATAP